MKRNNNCIEETIQDQLKEDSIIYEDIFRSFKKLYFDIKMSASRKGDDNNNNFNSLKKYGLQRLIDLNVIRFKQIPQLEGSDSEKSKFIAKNKDEFPIIVNKELKHFLKSCGNKLDDKDIEFMLHLVEDFPKFQKEKVLTCTQFYNIWGALIHFSTKTPEDIIEYVFKKHIETQNTLENSKMLNYSRLDHFLNTYKDYFNRKEKDYILNEVRFT